MASPYSDTLNSDNVEIRVLYISPAKKSLEPIRCTFRKVSLLDSPVPRYMALSYTWGDRYSKSDIFVNGIKCEVTTNLIYALRHLRRQDQEFCVWADAICINQTATAEKTAQLLIMENVYRHAECVLSWLGENSNNSSLAMEMIQRWASLGERLLLDPSSSSKLRKGSNLDEVFSTTATNAVNNLLERPYWTRVWIQQEIALHRAVLVQCGTWSLPFELFTQAQEVWAKLRKSTLQTPDMVHNWTDLAVPSVNIVGPLENLILLRQQEQNLLSEAQLTFSTNTLLFDFLRSYQHLEATDPRDRIYALLGLHSPMSKYRNRISPDYSKHPHTVFCDVARVMIEDDCDLRTVVLARNLTSTSQVKSLPSWVPDWTGTESLIPMHLHDQERQLRPEKRLDFSKSVKISADGMELSVSGIMHGTITGLQPAWAYQYQQQPEQLFETIRNQHLPNLSSVMRAIFHLLSHHLDPCVVLSEEQTDMYMTDAIYFLRFLLPSKMPETKLAQEIKAMSSIFFGRENLAFLERVDTAFPGSVHDKDSSVSENQITKKRQEAIGHAFWLQSLGTVRNRVFFEAQGSVGLGPVSVDVGDVVFQPHEHCCYLFLRPERSHFILRGEGSIVSLRADMQPFREDTGEEMNKLRTVDIR